MKIRPSTIFKSVGVLALLIVVTGLLVPFVNADSYAERLRGSLSRALGRQVEFRQRVKFNLFKGPGFAAEDVVIHEEPSIGAEPIAYVDTMEVRPSIWSLLGGRFVVASIRLEGAHINLSKSGPASEAGQWNFLSFVDRSMMSAAPAIHVRDGRINFKFGDTKSIFYLMETDLDISPPGSLGGGWKVSCSAKAARTDRPAQGLGAFTIKGRWFVAPERVDLDLLLDRGGLGEITALLRGQTGAVHGSISSKLHLGGPINDIGIQGRLSVEDVHRWDLMPGSGKGWAFDIRGRMNLEAQQLELQSNSQGNAPLPLWIRFRASDYLSRPHWGLTVNWNRFPAAPILELARHMGAQVPEKLQMAGVMDGAVGYSGDDFRGMVALRDFSLTIPDSPPVRFEEGYLIFDGGHIRVSPMLVHTAESDEARIESDYNSTDNTLDLTISTDAMKVDSLRAQVSLAAVPWLEQVHAGQWSGQLKYHRGSERSGWTGRLELRDAELPVPGLAVPLQLAAARAQIDGAHVVLDRIEGQAGKVAIAGGYTYEPGAAHPHHVRLRLDKVDAADLEALLAPTLSRSPGLLARALGRVSLPDWLEHRQADGSIQVNDLLVAGAHLENVRARMVWDKASLRFEGLQARLDKSAVTGQVTINLRGARPAYRVIGQVKGWNWQSGKLDTEATFETSGTGLQLLTNLTADGTFNGTALDFGGLTGRTVSGNYSMAWSQLAPRLKFTGLTMRTEDDTWTGRGGTQDDGKLLLTLTNGTSKEMRLSGPLDKVRVEEAKQ